MHQRILTLFAMVLALVLCSPAAWGRNIECGPTDADRARMTTFQARLAEAPSTEQAQALALRRIERSQRAVERANQLVPGDADLDQALRTLDAFEASVGAAGSPGEVAEAFGTWTQAQPLAGGCHYSTGEVIAIVLGFILGIIPGIILLILLC